MSVTPCLGIVAKPTSAPAFLIYVDHGVGRYVERNPALDCWRLTADRRYATRFASIEALQAALPRVVEDTADVWHLTTHDFSVREA